jgi:hypothetical protein
VKLESKKGYGNVSFAGQIEPRLLTYRLEDVGSDVRLGESQSLGVDVYDGKPISSALP